MKQGKLLWRIYAYFLIATLAALAIATGNAVRTVRHFHDAQLATDLDVLSRLAARDVQRLSPSRDAYDVDKLCKEIGRVSGTRMTVILPGGTVIGDSDETPADMDNHAERPEVAEALRGNTGTSVRYSNTLKQSFRYTAIPVQDAGAIVAVVRMSKPLAEIRWTQHAISRQLMQGGLFAAMLFAIVALYLSRRTTRPLEDMRRIAMRLADGDLTARVTVSTDDEIGALAHTMNDMAEQLGERIETIARQQVEQQAVLTCMAEGVFAVNTDGHILYLNEAAGRMLGIAPEQAHGRSVEETVRHHDVQEFVMATLTSATESEAEILLRGVPERHVQVRGTPLMAPGVGRIGGLVVVNDITRLKRLERVRTDFVANVSHELKTPITALKGCTETLTGDTPPEPADAARFTAMMSRHVLRLQAIVEDLLSLSRIEFDAAHGQVPRDRLPIHDLLQRVVNTYVETAHAKRIRLNMDCPRELSAPVNGPLLEQAIGNLVDNGLKYGGEETCIGVTARITEDEILIDVADQGPGIDAKHLPRIFERFYRVDTARSRALGGTGLGLSIVKHIALAHNGNVTAECPPTGGTTFTLHLPR